MAGMLGGQAGMMMTDPYMVHTTRAEARAERKLAALVAGFGEITRNNLLQFLFVFGRFSTAEDISYRQARTRLEDIVSPMVKQEIDSILEDAGPAVTPTAAQAEMKYMGGQWVAAEESVAGFGIGYEPATVADKQRKWYRKSVFEQSGAKPVPERQCLIPGTPQREARQTLEEEKKRLDQMETVTRSLSSSFSAVRQRSAERVVPQGAGEVGGIPGDHGALARPADEQNYLAFCAAWSEVLGVRAAVAGLQRHIRDIQVTPMGWDAVCKELDRVKMQVPMAVLFDKWATMRGIKQKWKFLSTWRERENGPTYNIHEAMLAAALLNQAPKAYLQKALDAGELGEQGAANYKKLRTYLKEVHSESKIIQMHQPLPMNTNPVNAFFGTHFQTSAKAGMIPGYGGNGAQLPGPPVPSAGPQTQAGQTSGGQSFASGGDQDTQVIAAIRKENEELREKEKKSRKQREEEEKKRKKIEEEMGRMKSNTARDARRQAKETLNDMLDREEERTRGRRERPRGERSRECYNWQDGHCRYADKCRFEHNGPPGKGGGRKSREEHNYYNRRGEGSRGSDNRGYKKAERRGREARRDFRPGRR